MTLFTDLLAEKFHRLIRNAVQHDPVTGEPEKKENVVSAGLALRWRVINAFQNEVELSEVETMDLLEDITRFFGERGMQRREYYKQSQLEISALKAENKRLSGKLQSLVSKLEREGFKF